MLQSVTMCQCHIGNYLVSTVLYLVHDSVPYCTVRTYRIQNIMNYCTVLYTGLVVVTDEGRCCLVQYSSVVFERYQFTVQYVRLLYFTVHTLYCTYTVLYTVQYSHTGTFCSQALYGVDGQYSISQWLRVLNRAKVFVKSFEKVQFTEFEFVVAGKQICRWQGSLQNQAN